MEFSSVTWIIPGALMGLLYIYSNLGKMRTALVSVPLNHTTNSKSRLSYVLWILLTIIAWGYISFSIMRPRLPLGIANQTINAKDIFIVVDVSRSMAAEDFQPNRLEVAREEIKRFVSSRPDDRIGIIMFSEKVFTLLPLTTDLELVLKMAENIQMGPLGMGTNIGDALGLAVARLRESEAKSKVIILLTDGVSNVGSMTPEQAADEAKANNVKLYSIGIGSLENARVLRRGFGFGGYQNIPGGSVDFKSLTEVSQKTGGKSYLASDPKSLTKVIDEIQGLEKSEIEKSGVIIYEELYYKYLLIGVVLLIISEFILRQFWRRLL